MSVAQKINDTINTEMSFRSMLVEHGLDELTRGPLTELQINLGKLCNQACAHCHVDAGPKRTEIMTAETMVRILTWAKRARITHVDLTGGAPELNPEFRRFVDAFLDLGTVVTSRCNLTVILEPGQQDLPGWYAERGVRLVCSLPCYTEQNVDAQRGKGVFDRSIRALQLLNQRGYGVDDQLPLELVYNPGGAFLPPPQASLEADYKHRLQTEFGIRFSRLLVLANIPINRFAHYLERSGQTEAYHRLLVDNFNPDTIQGLMCRHLISVDWRGRVYDCDFNQMLGLPLGGSHERFLWQVHVDHTDGQPVAVGRHCFGCTAGAGSSCGGALV
ncbi:MAG: arsenosugar biosynthesis radical SAM protein ArsS [Gammaproteobacteria bacterium]|nr:arsenosugar biosynthesis radical SAM protein ArsS [Gammaproteobacteria bacterium]